MRRSVALLLTGMLCACGGSSVAPEESKPSGTEETGTAAPADIEAPAENETDKTSESEVLTDFIAFLEGPWNIRTNDPITDSDSVLEFDLAGKSFMHLPELTDIYGQVLNCSAVMTHLVSRMMRSVSRHMKHLMI